MNANENIYYIATTSNIVLSSIRLHLTDSELTADLVCIKMASVSDAQSHDLKRSGTFSNHCEVIILSMKYLLKGQIKSLVLKMVVNEIDFHRLFEGILKVVFFPFLVESHTAYSGEDCKV